MLKNCFYLGVLLICSLHINAQTLQTGTQPEGLQIVMHSQVSPIPLNQMHSWIIEIQSTTDMMTDNAVISLSGGMPTHNHGLATNPQVTHYLGEGRFLLEGVRFHMAGVWILQLQIQLDNRHYTAQLELTI